MKRDLLKSVPGVGDVTVMTVLGCFPELGFITHKQAAALAGVAPMNRDSGRYQGMRKIRGGRPQIRTVIFMGMMSAIQCNAVFKRSMMRSFLLENPRKLPLSPVFVNSLLRSMLCCVTAHNGIQK